MSWIYIIIQQLAVLAAGVIIGLVVYEHAAW